MIGLLGGLSGCVAALGGGTADGGSVADGSTPTADESLSVPDDQLAYGAGKDAIAAITEPAFGPDWRDTELTLPADATVIGAGRDGAARAYRLSILNRHEVVNDGFGGPLLVTSCPLCASGVTGVRRVDGEPTVFGVSGRLWKSDLVMYDRAT